MKLRFLLVLLLSLLMSACANPLNQATANRYLDQCTEAERQGRLDIAEQACYRALVNVDWGNLGDEQKSQNLYNLARIKGRIGKLNEAEELHLQSIEIEKKLSSELTTRIGRRYVELAIVYLMKTEMAQGEIKPEGVDLSQGENRINDGAALLKEMEPISNMFSGRERQSVKNIYQFYSEELKKQNQNELSLEFANISEKL